MITLATLNDATAQQVFDQVAKHMIKQGKQSINSVMECVYRGPNGLKCAAGCLISDDEYDPKFDGNNMSWSLLVNAGYVPSKHSNLIRLMQSVHDRQDGQHGGWVMDLRIAAKQFGLSDEVLNESV